MMKKLLFTLLTSMLLFSACEKKIGKLPLVYKDYLIETYLAPEQFSIRVYDQAPFILYLDFEGPRFSVSSQDPADLSEFYRLAAKNGDKLGREIYLTPGYDSYVSFSEEFVSIDVRSDGQWDAKHPAGSSLNDVAGFRGNSFAPFIRSGYSGEQMTPVGGILNKIPSGSLDLLAYDWNMWVYFEKTELTERQTITVTLTTESGRVLTATAQLAPSN